MKVTEPEAEARRRRAVVLLAGVVLLVVVTWGTAYDAGKDAAEGALDCKPGNVLSITSSGGGTAPDTKLERTLQLGDCERISEDAFATALEALAANPFDGEKDCPTAPTTTTSTTAAPKTPPAADCPT